MKTQIMTAATLMMTGIATAVTYPVVDTGQNQAFGNYAGQDAHYTGNPPTYRDNGDGTVSDLITGLMWTKDPGEKMTYAQAVKNAVKCRVGGYSDWRLPTIKELYSLIKFDGLDPDPTAEETANLRPFIDNSVFEFHYGDRSKGERIIDSQFATSTKYVSTTMNGNETMFGVNFADGRIKGYPIKSPRGEKTFYVLYVRGNPEYGKNRFVDNGDGTITDKATGLTWMKADSGKTMDWPSALKYAEEMEFAGYDDWRLPNAKELQSIVDYTRSPDTTGSAAIDPIFEATEIVNEGGEKDFAYYWTSTTHASFQRNNAAVYIAFGRALGWMGPDGSKKLMDVHGAGAQRSDPKTGDASRYPYGRGPQGDVIRIQNMVRLVRGGNVKKTDAPVVKETISVRRDLPSQSNSAPFSRHPGRRREPPPVEDFLKRFDANKDGQVTKKEFTGPPNRFAIFDTNGDEILSREEIEARPLPRQRGSRTAQQKPQTERTRGSFFGNTFLERFDVNRDGQVTKEEFTGSPQRFPRLDRDSNGIITKDEVPPGPPKGRRERSVEPHPFELPEGGNTLAVPMPSGKTSKPNFVLILADDMGWTGLSVAMDNQIKTSKSDFYLTPNIEALARQGMRFPHAYSPGPLCTPSRAGILTGKTPAELHLTTPGPGRASSENYHRVITFNQVNKLPKEEQTIAELLKKVGYATAHFGKWHLGRVSPGEHGFDYHDGATENRGPAKCKDPNPKDIFGITKRAIDFMIGQVNIGKPFYLQLSHYAVHEPIEALHTTIEKFRKLSPGIRHTDPEYAAMTFDLDTAIGSLLEKIDALGIADTTYVVFMSDNGAPSGRRISSISHNFPLAKGKGTLYEGGIRVPLIVRGPGIKAGTFCSENVTGCDLLPTFCELAGVKTGKIEGTSLVPLLHGYPEKFQRREKSLIFHYPHYNQGLQKPCSAIILKNFKLIKNYDSDTVELFDLDADISETRNLSKEMPEKAAELEEMLEIRLRKINAQIPRPNPNYDPNAAAERTRHRVPRR